MPMTSLPNIIPVSPIAAIGKNRRAELNRRLGLSADEKLVLVSLGGIASRLADRTLAAYRRCALAGAGKLAGRTSRCHHPGNIADEFQRPARQQRRADLQTGLRQLRRGRLQRRAGTLCQPRRLAGIARPGFMAATIRPVPRSLAAGAGYREILRKCWKKSGMHQDRSRSFRKAASR